jgi:RNA polymerase sigma-70 factor (ECF subfamily)
MHTLASPAVSQAPPQTKELSEAEAIRRAQVGDAAAFERLYQLHSRRVYSLCLRMIANTAEAEDLTQEAFLQLFRKIKTFRGESAFSTWLHRLAVNIVLMRLRKRTLKQTSLETGDEHQQEALAPKEIGTRDLVLAGVIDRLRLKDAIAKLPEGYRMIFTLHDVQGFEHHEIAAQLKCTIGNSKSQLHKARVRLRHFLTQPEPAQERQDPGHFLPHHDRVVPALKSLRARRAPKRLKLCTSEA